MTKAIGLLLTVIAALLAASAAAPDAQAQEEGALVAPSYSDGPFDIIDAITEWCEVSVDWHVHIKGLPFNNFPLRNDQGHFLKCSHASMFVPE